MLALSHLWAVGSLALAVNVVGQLLSCRDPSDCLACCCLPVLVASAGGAQVWLPIEPTERHTVCVHDLRAKKSKWQSIGFGEVSLPDIGDPHRIPFGTVRCF